MFGLGISTALASPEPATVDGESTTVDGESTNVDGEPASVDGEPGLAGRRAWVRGEGVDTEALLTELAMRVPDLEFTAALDDGVDAHLEVRRETGSLHRIAVVFADGRAYYERVDVGEAGTPERVIASSVANLLFSIDSGDLEPDRVGVPFVAPEPESEPESAAPASADPDPGAPTLERPGIEVGVGARLGQRSALGGPRFADVHLGFFGGVEVAVRSARGLLVTLGVDVGGSARGPHQLTVVHGVVGVGYAWRGPRFELLTELRVGVAPWWVASRAESVSVSPLDTSGLARPPLVTVGARISPGYHVVLDRGPVAGLHVGPQLALTGGFVASSPPRVAGLVAADGEPLFRLGGAELYSGLELLIWLRRPGL